LWLTILCGTIFGQQNRLTLLSPTNNFSLDILNCAFGKHTQTTDVIMLEIEENNGSTDGGSYELRLTSLIPIDFLFFKFVSDKYIGYFDFHEHTVIVYGNTSANFFFTKRPTQKQFPFLPSKPIDDSVKAVLEPFVCIYKFSSNKFTLTNVARLGFYR